MSYAQAALGGEIIIDTLDGKVSYEVKPGTPTDTRIRLRGKGIPTLRNKNVRGDHYVNLVIQVPTGMSGDAKQKLMEFDALTGDSLNKHESVEPKPKKGKKNPFSRK
jgi:molecular chaperone DnaJ